MALLRPSLTLVLDLDERLASKDTVQEIKRCYPYIGVPVVRSHEPASSDAPIENRARMVVGFGTRKYLRSADEGADDLWDGVVSRWIGNMLHKVGSTMRAFNTRQRKIGLPEVVFDRVRIELQGGEFSVALHTDPLSFIDFDARDFVDQARNLLNEGALEGATGVLIPSDEDYETQRGEAFSAWTREHPEPEADPEQGEDASDHEAEAEEERAPEPKLSREEWLELDKQAKSYENTAVPPTDSDTLPPVEREKEPPEPERFSFAVDYAREWTVSFGDGTSRAFCPATRRFRD